MERRATVDFSPAAQRRVTMGCTDACADRRRAEAPSWVVRGLAGGDTRPRPCGGAPPRTGRLHRPDPWTLPPVPPLNDHYCLYMRVLSVQATPPVEGMSIDTDVANNNNLAWRNIKVVAPGDNRPPSFFIVRNIDKEREALTLQFELPEILLRLKPSIRITLDAALQSAFKTGAGKTIGLKPIGAGTFQMTGVSATITGLELAPKAEGHVRVLVATKQALPADITIRQIGPHGVEGGVTLRLAKK
jgi:hypothetical protein